MYAGQREKLERYLRNAEQFLWGVIPGNKQAVFAALRENLKRLGEDTSILDGKNPTYAMATESLLTKLGIERIITKIIAVQVKRQFDTRPGTLELLRAHWISGTLPRWQILQTLRAPRTVKQKLAEAFGPGESTRPPKQTADIIDAFVEVNTQYEYVHGWTVFAGLWFEEIEPLLQADTEKEKGSVVPGARKQPN